jgi:PTH1 family peptidyl-tRNA hydrolase
MGKFLIVGLGNIGADYAGTRHNIGFDVADALAASLNGQFSNVRLAEKAELKWKGHIFICIKPNTYMNLSGQAVKYWMDKEKIVVENTLVILDDLALPLSKLRLRPGGSSGGHNGLKSIEASLGRNDYPRLRFGIGNGFSRGSQVDFVLGGWDEAELPIVRKKVGICVEIVESFAAIGLERTMNQYNKLEFEL